MSTNCICNTKDKMILADAPEPVIMEAAFRSVSSMLLSVSTSVVWS